MVLDGRLLSARNKEGKAFRYQGILRKDTCREVGNQIPYDSLELRSIDESSNRMYSHRHSNRLNKTVLIEKKCKKRTAVEAECQVLGCAVGHFPI